MNLIEDVKDEVRMFLSGKTVDALFPSLVYFITNSFFGLEIAVIASLSVAGFFTVKRLINKETILYALSAIVGVGIAAGFALVADSASNYYIPSLINSAVSFIVTVISVLIGRPLAALVSHVSRGWTFKWFMRKDIKPAYREVSIAWAILFLIRFMIQWQLYQSGDVTTLGWASFVLGLPATIFVLILTLIYGVWRLKKLGGPGIDEFDANKEPPYLGQRKGF